MERASAVPVIDVLKLNVIGLPHGIRPRRRMLVPAQPKNLDQWGRCRCGRCDECMENARWERIFTQKFADPSYYTGPVVRAASPLASL